MTDFELRPVGRVESALIEPEAAPRQGDEGAPDAWLVLEPGVSAALYGLRVGDSIHILTWLHLARRDVLAVHPRGDAARELTGVFSTRSPHRPNPIGLHTVEIRAIDDTRIRVSNLEAVHDTPILDIKPVLTGIAER